MLFVGERRGRKLPSMNGSFGSIAVGCDWPLPTDSIEKLSSAAANWSAVSAIEVTGSHFKLPFGVLLSFLAQV